MMSRSKVDGAGRASGASDGAMTGFEGGVFDVWAKCAAALSETSLVMADRTTRSMLSAWNAPSNDVDVSSATSSNTRRSAQRFDDRPEATFTDARRSVESVGLEPGRSWYKSPYRSPFDPLFWLQPDTSRSFVAPTAVAPAAMSIPAFPTVTFPTPAMPALGSVANFWPGLWPVQPAPAMAPFTWFQPNATAFAGVMQPGFAPHGQFGSGSAALPPAFAPFAPLINAMTAGAMAGAMTGAVSGAMTGAGANHSPANSWQPMMASWLSMMPQLAPVQPTNAPTPFDPTGFSAYRSAGGFAVAQAFMDEASKTPAAVAKASPDWFSLAFPWLRK